MPLITQPTVRLDATSGSNRGGNRRAKPEIAAVVIEDENVIVNVSDATQVIQNLWAGDRIGAADAILLVSILQWAARKAA